jgi:hypothetical protein
MKRFLRWLVELFDGTGPEQKAEVKKPSSINRSRSILAQWQADDERVNWARTSNEFAELISIYERLHPSGYPVRGSAITDIQAAVELGRHEGYWDGHAVLLTLREFPPIAPIEIQADYSQDEETQEAR